MSINQQMAHCTATRHATEVVVVHDRQLVDMLFVVDESEEMHGNIDSLVYDILTVNADAGGRHALQPTLVPSAAC